MAVESATYIDGLNAAYPAGGEPIAQGDDHLRLIKTTLKNTFPTLNGPLSAALVPFTPAGTLAATNVQAAIAELDSETQTALALKANASDVTTSLASKVNKAGDTMTGDLAISNTGEGGELRLYETASGKNAAFDMIAATDRARISHAMGGTTRTWDFQSDGSLLGTYYQAAVNGYGYAFQNDPDTGMRSSGDGFLSLYSNNILRMEVDNRVKIYSGYSADWNNKQLVVEESGGSSPGIGFHAPANSSAAIFKYYGGSGTFECRNGPDSSYTHLAAASITGNGTLTSNGSTNLNGNISIGQAGDRSHIIYLTQSYNSSEIAARHRPGTDYGVWFPPAGGSEFYFANNGIMYTAAGAAPASDGRVKSNREVISDALAKVQQLVGCTYNRLDIAGYDGAENTQRYAGLIAQDVEKVLPECVGRFGEVPDELKTPDDDGDKRSLIYDGITALLVEAVKELSAKVTALEAQLAAK